MKHAQLTWLSNKRTKIAHTLDLPLRKETPRSSPLFIYSCCSPADIPPALLRRPRNKHTGWGGESLGRREVVETGGAFSKQQNHCVLQKLWWNYMSVLNVVFECFFTHTEGAHFWCVHEMLGMSRMVNMTEEMCHVKLKRDQSECLTSCSAQHKTLYLVEINFRDNVLLSVYNNRPFL